MTDATAPLRAAIYCRVSSSKQEEQGYSLDGQLAECRILADRLGARVVDERWEVGSGADWDLPVVLELMEAARRGDYDVLLVYDTSRLARDIGKLKVLERMLTQAGVQLRFVRQEFEDTPAGDLQKNIMASFDSFERANLVLRFKLGKRAKIGRGLVVGQGRVPFGYQRIVSAKTGKTVQLAINDAQAAIVRRIVADLREYSVDQVAERLNAEEIPSPTSQYWESESEDEPTALVDVSRWSGATIYAIVRNPAIRGDYVHGKTADLVVTTPTGPQRRTVRRPVDEWSAVPVPPIVSDEDVRAAREAMGRRKVTHGPRRANAENDPFLLRGMLTCGRCGGQISAAMQRVTKRQPNGERRDYGLVRYYQCIRSKGAVAERKNMPRCDLSWLPAVPIEDYAQVLVEEVLRDREQMEAEFGRRRAKPFVQDDDTVRDKSLEDQIARLRRRLDRITTERLDAEPGSESERTLTAVAAETGEHLTQLKRELDAIKAVRSRPTDPELADLRRFLDTIGAVIDGLTRTEWRRAFEMLDFRGVVTPDANGILIGRRGYYVECRIAIDDYSQPILLNQTRMATKMAAMSADTTAKAGSQSWDGNKRKFMP